MPRRSRAPRLLLPAVLALAAVFFAGLLWDASTAHITGGKGAGGAGDAGNPDGSGDRGGLQGTSGPAIGGITAEPGGGGSEPAGGGPAPAQPLLLTRTQDAVVVAGQPIIVFDDRAQSTFRQFAFTPPAALAGHRLSVAITEQDRFARPLLANLLTHRVVSITVTDSTAPFQTVATGPLYVTVQVPYAVVLDNAVLPGNLALFRLPDGPAGAAAEIPRASLAIEEGPQPGERDDRLIAEFLLPHLSLFSLGFKVEAPSQCNFNGVCELSENAATCEDCSTLLRCSPGQKRCAGDVLQQCTESRQWKAAAACPGGCSGGACVGEERPVSGPIAIPAGGEATFYLFLGGILAFLLVLTLILKYAFG